MNCLKCGSKNLDEKMICLDCGNDNHKGNHIDIDDVRPKAKNHHNFEHARKVVLLFILFIVIMTMAFGATILVYFIKEKSNVKVIDEFNNYSKNSSVYVLYMGNNSAYDDELKIYQKYYEFDYQKINVGRLTIKNTKRFKDKFKLNKLKNSIIIYKKGNLVAAENVTNVDEMNNILKDNKVIPTVIEDPTNEKELINNTLSGEEDTLIYVSFVNNDLVKEKSDALKAQCDEYKIKYQFIRGYIFSEKQILNYMNQFNYSSIKNELIVILENKEVKKIIEFDSLYYVDYIEIFKNYDIINSISDYLKYININDFNELIKTDEKNIFVFGDSKCKYCDSLKYTLGSIAKEKNIAIYYIDLPDDANLADSLKSLEYEGNYTYPLTIIVENKKILDYVIGDSEKDYYINLFTKDGIIR